MKTFLQIVFLVFAFCSLKAQRAGTLDSSFGEDGFLIKSNPEYSVAYGSSTVLHDDKILVGGGIVSDSSVSGVYKYLSDGKPDISFGKEGFAALPNSADIKAIIEQNDYKITTVGISFYPSPEYARLKADGSPDSTFGKNGYLIDTSIKYYQQAFDIAQQEDGKLVSCAIIVPDFNTLSSFCVVTRINANGTLDNTFGEKGHVIFDESDFQPAAIAVQADGKIVCAGSYQGCRLVRLNRDGSLDKTFGVNGYAITRFSKYVDYFSDLVIQPDGKIVATGAGGTNSFKGTPPFWIIGRYNSDGSLDESFGDAGKASVKVPDSYAIAESVALQKDKKIVIGGWVSIKSSAFSVARFREDGVADSSFGENGLTMSYIDLPQNGEGQDVGIQSNGRIILSGFLVNEKSQYSYAIAGYVGSSKQQSPIVKKIKRWIRNHTLSWQYNNANVDYFVIEQSSNDVNGFKEIGRVNGHQSLVNSGYSYSLNNSIVNRQLSSVNYYRITAVNTNGSKVVSDVISDDDIINITVSPNPVKDVLKVSGLHVNQKATISIINRSGNVLQTAVSNSSTYNMNVSGLQSGLYDVQVNVDGRLQSVKFVKE